MFIIVGLLFRVDSMFQGAPAVRNWFSRHTSVAAGGWRWGLEPGDRAGNPIARGPLGRFAGWRPLPPAPL